MHSEMNHNKSRVVVIGGGISGAFLVKSLQYDADVVLIDPKEYFEISWAQLRSMVEPSFVDRATIKHADYFKNGRVIISSAVNVTETDVLTSDGRCIPYDFLVIATGHKVFVPEDRISRMQQFQADYQQIKSSASILIVGGGPTGVELAGEIVVDFPEKKVILVHGGSRLMEFVGRKASAKALDWLTSRKVEVLLNQRVDLNSFSEGQRTYKTSAGETIVADCHFLCVGTPLGSSWLKDSLLENSLDFQGRLKVDESLRVIDHKNIFAMGDITNIPELKQGFLAKQHAKVVAKNIKRMIKDGNEEKLARYKPGPDIAFVSLGRKEAIAVLPFATIRGCLPGRIKSKDLFVGNTRKELGLSPY